MTNRPRIVYVVHDFLPEVTAGTELHTLWLAEELSNKYEIFIFTGTHDPPLEEYATRDEEFQGLKVRRIKFSNRDWVHPADFYLNPTIRDIFASYIDEIHPALIHIHHTIGLSATIIEVAAARCIPTILQLRDFHYMCQRNHLLDAYGKLCIGPLDGRKCADCFQSDSNPYIPKDLATLYSRPMFEQAGLDRAAYMRTLLLLPDLIICPSRFLKEKFVEFGVPDSKISVSPEGIKIDGVLRQRRERNKEKVVFGFLGNLAYHKGLNELIEAFATLDQSKAELKIYGGRDTAYIERLRARAQDLNVKFMGEYYHEQLPEILSNLDVVVHPSICHESYSIVVYEALAAGVPVIVSDIPAQRDAVSNGVDGLHFHAGDAEDLSRKMNLLIENPDILTNLRMHMPHVRAISDQAKEFATIYEELMRETNRENPNTETLVKLEEIRQRIDRKSLEQQIVLRRRFVAEAADWTRTLLAIYDSREDLQRSFPEVRKGELDNLVEWAIGVMQRKHLDSSYEEIMATASKPLFTHLSQLVDELRDRDETNAKLTGELESLRKQMVEELRKRDESLFGLSEELRKRDEVIREIESSVAWKLIDTYRRIVSKLFPEGTRRRRFLDLLTVAVSIATEKGFRRLIRITIERYIERRRDFHPLSLEDKQYQVWLKNYEFTDEIITRMHEEIARFRYKPKISIVMPVYNTDRKWLKMAIDSVIQQVYPNWELCIADDASTKKYVRQVLEEYCKKDTRIRVTYSKRNSGIAAASNAALSLATGEFVGFLDHDDELTLDTLFEVVKLLNQRPDIDYMYTDEDKKDLKGRRVEPFFKPDWSPHLFLSMNYVTHFSVVRKSLLDELKGLRLGFDGSQDYDLILRLTEITDRIGHIPKPLYSWRKTPQSSATSTRAKPYAYVAAKRALNEALSRRGIHGHVIDSEFKGLYRATYRLEHEPSVSIIIPTRDNVRCLRKCMEGLRFKTDYQNYEIIVIDNGSQNSEMLEYLRSLPFLILREESEFNFSKLINLGGKHASGKYLLLLNDDVEVSDALWLKEMVGIAEHDDVGIVGPKLLFPDGTVQHAGIIVGVKGTAGHAFYRHCSADPGYFGLLKVARDCSAVTAACMLVKKNVFDQVKGFDETFRVAYGDVDFCLRVINETGLRVVYTPFALLLHHESSTRGALSPLEDGEYFRKRWKCFLEKGDPYYNPNLSLELPYQIKITPDMLKRIAEVELPLATLLSVYYQRQDLQRAYPEVEKGKYQRLIDWATECGVSFDSARYLLWPYSSWYIDNVSEEVRPLAVLLNLYNSNSDLQVQFPEVLKGRYEGLLAWAADALSKESSVPHLNIEALRPYKSWYRSAIRLE